MKRLFLLLGILSISVAGAQTPIEKPDLNTVSLITPYYFGPNAFPVPDMLDGRTLSTLRVELAGDCFFGKRGDFTTDAAFKFQIPLWTRFANLSVWMPVFEWFRNTEENMTACRIPEIYRDEARRGHGSGDVYVSFDTQILTEEKRFVDVVLRTVLKTAPGGNYYLARFYDSPGYFSDVAIGKSFALGRTPLNHRLRLAVSGGFLCWQTDHGRQNDAIMYGAMVKYENKYLTVLQTVGGYSGWEGPVGRRIGVPAHDRPLTLKTNLAVKVKNYEILVAYQYGLRDYPYQQLRIGLARHFDVLKKRTDATY